MLISCLLILIGLALLAYGANVFVDGASALAYLLGISPLIIGLIIVGFATSAPEILTGSIAAWQGKTTIAIGNAIGSNITNIGLILGISALVFPIAVKSDSIKKEYGLLCGAIILAFVLMIDGHLSRIDAVILLIALTIVMSLIIWIARQKKNADPLAQATQLEVKKMNLGKAWASVLIGLILLLFGAHLLVSGAVAIAEHYDIPELIIGLTIVAIGTSLPELAASIASLMKKESDIAIGNIIGSNLFNTFTVLGLPVLIHPTDFTTDVITRDFPVMFGLTILLGTMLFLFGQGKLIRIEGGLLLLCFIGYQYLLFIQSSVY